MSQKELQRAAVLEQVKNGNLTLLRASEAMGVSYRHAKRLKARYLARGACGIIHGNRGRAGPRRLDADLRERVMLLLLDKYTDANNTHCAELLAEREGIKLSRETIRRLRLSAGLPPKRTRKAPLHRIRREPKELPGELIQWDGSPHRWFGSDRPMCTLMAAADDAESRLLSARFEPSESTVAYLRLLSGVVTKYGIPVAVYQDGHGALFRNDDHWSLAEQLAGHQKPTQVGAVLAELGIKPVRAHSPQAKGRIERMFNTLQDRLIVELALAGITEVEIANPWLEQVFLPRFNKRFAHQARGEGSLFRNPKKLKLEEIIALRFERVVGNDNTVHIGGLRIDIPPGPRARSYAKCRVELRQLLDRSWRVFYQRQLIAKHGPTEFYRPAARQKKRLPSREQRSWS